MAGAIHLAHVCVIEIQIADHHAVGEHRQFPARLDSAEQDCPKLLLIDIARELHRHLSPSRRGTTQRAPEGIEDGALCNPYALLWEVLISEARRIAGKFLSQGNLLAIANGGTLRFLRYHRRDWYSYP